MVDRDKDSYNPYRDRTGRGTDASLPSTPSQNPGDSLIEDRRSLADQAENEGDEVDLDGVVETDKVEQRPNPEKLAD